MSLCSVEDVQRYLLITFENTDPSTTEDALGRIEYLIDAVSKEINTICYRTFEADDYDVVMDGNGTNSLFLDNYPVISLTTLEYGSPFGTVNRTEIASDERVLYSDIGQLSLLFTSVESPQYFRVVYRAGYEEDNIPYDLNLICVKEVVRALSETTTNTGLKQEKLGDASWTYFSSVENKENLTKKLSQYIRNDI